MNLSLLSIVEEALKGKTKDLQEEMNIIFEKNCFGYIQHEEKLVEIEENIRNELRTLEYEIHSQGERSQKIGTDLETLKTFTESHEKKYLRMNDKRTQR